MTTLLRSPLWRRLHHGSRNLDKPQRTRVTHHTRALPTAHPARARSSAHTCGSSALEIGANADPAGIRRRPRPEEQLPAPPNALHRPDRASASTVRDGTCDMGSLISWYVCNYKRGKQQQYCPCIGRRIRNNQQRRTRKPRHMPPLAYRQKALNPRNEDVSMAP